MTDTELLDALEQEATGVWELDGGWSCDLQSGPVGEGDTPREAIADAIKKLRRKSER